MSSSGASRPRRLRMSQPAVMKTRRYLCDDEYVNGNDAWALFKAAAEGNRSRAENLLARDPRLARAQFWYQFPIHAAVREGHTDLVRLLLESGCDPGRSVFLHNSWRELLQTARERDYRDVEKLLRREMRKRFAYTAEFDPVAQAVLARNPRRVLSLLRKHPQLVKAADAQGQNAIHLAVATRQMSLIDRLVALGVPIDAQRADGRTPLLLSLYWYCAIHPPEAIRNRWAIAGRLLALGSRYVLSAAAALGDLEHVQSLLAKRPQLATEYDSAFGTALGYGAREGYLHIVQTLLDHGADPNAPETGASRGMALYYASCGNHIEVARVLLDHGADPNAGFDSSECAMTICRRYHGDAGQSMYELIRSRGGHTPTYYMSVREMKRAIREQHVVVKDEEFLGNVLEKQNPALLDLYFEYHPQAIHELQCWSGVIYPHSPALVRRLVRMGLDPNRPDWIGRTFLHACAEQFDVPCAREFIRAGANIHARDVDRCETPLCAAVRSERDSASGSRLDMVRFLLESGARVNDPDDPPWSSPLLHARQRGDTETESLLRAWSADG